jgi:predicted permease
MTPEIHTAVLATSFAKLFLLSAIGYVAVRIGILPTRAIKGLSKLVINVTLPSLIIVTMGRHLDPSMIGLMGFSVVVAFMMNSGGFVLALIARRLFIKKDDQSRNLFVSLSAIQNAGFLPIPLITAILPEETQAYGLLLVFFYMFVMNPLLWSVGISLITGDMSKGLRSNARKVLNPPFIALSLGVLFMVPQVKAAFISLDVITGLLTTIGKPTIPLALIILGGSFGEKLSLRGGGLRMIAVSTAVKMIAVPLCVIGAVILTGPEYIFGLVLIIEASMPAAVNHIVIVRSFGGDIALTTRALFVQYALSVVTVPLFLFWARAIL